MKGLIQRVRQASVSVNGEVVADIDQGLLLLLGIEKQDNEQSAQQLLSKVCHYRVFADAQQKMNLSLVDIAGGLLIVSQFTLAAQTQSGRRPGFSKAASPQQARKLYDYFVDQACSFSAPVTVKQGVFAADMQVQLVNDGPVTFLLEA